MAKKQAKQNKKPMVVTLSHVATPAKERLARVIDILLRAAARDTSQAEDSPDADKEKPSARGTHEATDDGEMSNGNDANLSHE